MLGQTGLLAVHWLSPYEHTRIQRITVVSPVLVYSSFESIQRWSRHHLTWQIIPWGKHTVGKKCQPGMWTTMSLQQLVIMSSQSSYRCSWQKFSWSDWIDSTGIFKHFNHITTVTTIHYYTRSYVAVLTGRITGPACSSVCPLRATNSKTRRCRKTKIVLPRAGVSSVAIVSSPKVRVRVGIMAAQCTGRVRLACRWMAAYHVGTGLTPSLVWPSYSRTRPLSPIFNVTHRFNDEKCLTVYTSVYCSSSAWYSLWGDYDESVFRTVGSTGSVRFSISLRFLARSQLTYVLSSSTTGGRRVSATAEQNSTDNSGRFHGT